MISLTVAGSDPTGGAGVQGDLRTFAAFGLHALSAITCITVQGTRGVAEVVPIDAALVRRQIECVLGDVAIAVVKTGALATAAIVREVAAAIASRPSIPLVVDPVIASSSGARLLDDQGIRRVIDELMPLAIVLTPNLDELALLTGMARAASPDAMEEQARWLLQRGAKAVVAKGGHLEGAPIDLLVERQSIQKYERTRIDSACTHGTGCAFASAIASRIALGDRLDRAVAIAKEFVAEGIRTGQPIGQGTSPLGIRLATVR